MRIKDSRVIVSGRENVSIPFKKDRDATILRTHPCKTVDGRGGIIDLIKQLFGDIVSHPDSGYIPMALLSDVTNEDPCNFRLSELWAPNEKPPPNDIGVHPRATNIFPHFIQDQDIHLIKGKRRNQPSRLLQKGLLLLDQFLGF